MCKDLRVSEIALNEVKGNLYITFRHFKDNKTGGNYLIIGYGSNVKGFHTGVKLSLFFYLVFGGGSKEITIVSLGTSTPHTVEVYAQTLLLRTGFT